MSFYKWNRIFDSGVKYIGSTGIIALGPSGLLRPIENIQMPLNVEMFSCVPYFDGYLLISPGTLIYTTINGSTSENKLDLALIDGVFIDGVVILGTSDGKLLYSDKPLIFKEHSRKLAKINRINKCDNKAVICGDTTIALLWAQDNKVQFKQLSTVYHHINAYLYNDKLITYSSDGYLNIYFVDEEFNILANTIHRINIAKHLSDAKVNTIYVDNGDIYFVCDNGTIALMPDFRYTRESIDAIGDKLILYAAKLTANSYFTDMMHYNDEFIIVGYGEEMNSCIMTKELKSSIINHNILTNITGPQRYMYNFANTYECKYASNGGDINKLGIVMVKELPVHKMFNEKYILLHEMNLDVRGFNVIDIPDSITKGVYGDSVPVNTDKATCKVIISIPGNLIGVE